MTEQNENTLNRLLGMVQDLDYSAASDGASDCHPSIKTESLYEALAIALRHAITDRAQRQAGQEPAEVQYRMAPVWIDAATRWNGVAWGKCSPASAADYERAKIVNDWEYQVRRLYAAPQPAAQPDKDAEIERILAASRYSADLCTQALDTVREQTAEIAALKADAKRYRWLRNATESAVTHLLDKAETDTHMNVD